jgi:hypothetical protein
LNKLLLLLLSFITLVACEQDAFFQVPEGNSKLYAYSEICSGEKIKVSVNTSVGVNTDDSFLYPKQSDAEVTLYKDGIALSDPGFRYIAAEEKFISQGSFRPEIGVEYSLGVQLKETSRIIPIYGTTTIPKPDSLEEVKISKMIISPSIGNAVDFKLKSGIDLSVLENNYFMIKVNIIDHNGKKREVKSFQVLEGIEGSTYSRHRNALLINRHKTNTDLVFAIQGTISANVDVSFKEAEFELVTITEDAYNYYKAHSKQLDAQSAAISEPVISYSNFENGLGLFTGFSSTTSIFTIE